MQLIQVSLSLNKPIFRWLNLRISFFYQSHIYYMLAEQAEQDFS